MSFHDFPADLFPDLLSRLPAKILIKFKSVSKLWLRIIEDHKFTTMHANRLSNSSSITHICLYSNYVGGSGYRKYRIFEINLRGGVDAALEEFRTLPGEISSKPIRLVGSSNGVLCLVYAEKSFATESVILWNPLSEKYQWLPPLPEPAFCHNNHSYSLYMYGFGYDKVNDDYKVLCFHGDFRCYNVVFSLKLKTWRNIDMRPFPLEMDPFPLEMALNGVLFAGSLHWVFKGQLIAFDLATEQFKSFSQPSIGPGHLGILRDGRLYHIARNTHGSLVFRIMLDYECCTELSFGEPAIATAIDITDVSFEPVAYVKNPREVVIIYQSGWKSKLVFYDVEKQSVIDGEASNDDDPISGGLFPYIHTLEFY